MSVGRTKEYVAPLRQSFLTSAYIPVLGQRILVPGNCSSNYRVFSSTQSIYALETSSIPKVASGCQSLIKKKMVLNQNGTSKSPMGFFKVLKIKVPNAYHSNPGTVS